MMSTHRHQRHTAFLILFALAVTIGLGACETDETGTDTETTTDNLTEDTTNVTTGQDTGRATTGGEMGTATELTEDPAGFIGERVQIDGEIAEILAEDAYTVDYGWTGGSARVIVPQDLQADTPELSQGDQVSISGTVEEYVPTETENEYELEETFDWTEGDPVIVADDVVLSE